jgi:hypothetical protein
MRSGETLGMGLENIDEQLHHSFLIIRLPLSPQTRTFGKAQHYNRQISE